MGIPLEVIALIAQFIEPSPLRYLRIAGVSRQFYLVFMADRLWNKLNFWGSTHNISAAFVDRALSWSASQRKELLSCWSELNVGCTISHISTLDALFGAIANGVEIFPRPVISDPLFMSCLLKLYPGSYRYASETLRDCHELALEAVRCNRYAFWYTSERLRSNEQICLAAIQFDPWCLEQAPPRIQANVDIVLQAVQLDGRCLKFASKELQNYEPVVQAAVAQNGVAIKFASERLRSDFSLALKAMEQNCWGWLGISSELQNDQTVIDAALANSHPHDWQLVQQISHQVQTSGLSRELSAPLRSTSIPLSINA